MLRGITVESYYEGSCVYRGDGSLDYILHPEGVVRATGQGLSHEYFLKDHLGSTRVVFGSNGAVLQATDYYAFGLEHTPLAISNTNRYLYNGKELQDETFAGGVRLGWYDYGARFYDPAIARWHVIDNKAEKCFSTSQYVYALNNPIKFIDPDGNEVKLINAVNIDNNGNYVYESGVSSKTQNVLTNVVQTEEGRNYIGQFAKAGQVIGGYKFESDGKYSDHDLIIQDFSLEKYTGDQNPITFEGYNITRLNEKEGKVETFIQLNSSSQSEGALAETATEEMQLHGFRDKKNIDAYKSGGKDGFNKSHDEDPGWKKDHQAFNKSDTKHEGFVKYQKMRDELIKVCQKYQQSFDDARKKGK